MYVNLYSHGVLNVASHLAVLQVCSFLLLFLGHHPRDLRTENKTALNQLFTNECVCVCVCVCVLERVCGQILVFVCLLVVHVLVLLLLLLLQGCVWRFVAHVVNSHVPLLRAELLCIPQDSRDDLGLMTSLQECAGHSADLPTWSHHCCYSCSPLRQIERKCSFTLNIKD